MIQRLLVLGLLVLPATGCGSLITAGVRETDDHGHHARYESKSYGGHFVDALFEPEEPRCHDTTVVVVERHH